MPRITFEFEYSLEDKTPKKLADFCSDIHCLMCNTKYTLMENQAYDRREGIEESVDSSFYSCLYKGLESLYTSLSEDVKGMVSEEEYYQLFEDEDEDDLEDHVACFSYPCCDDAPTGCRVRYGSDVEPIGHRD